MALTASENDQARLLDLQALDTRLQQLDHRAKTLPENATLQALGTDAERRRLERNAELGAVEDATAELARIESDVAVVEARITRDTGRLEASSSVKDVAGLEHELASLRRRRDELEDIELGVMEKLENLERAASLVATEHTDILAKTAAVTLERDAALAALESEREQARANRAAIAESLPPELVALYERQRQRYGSGASHLRGGVSSASGVKLLENELAIVRAAAPEDVLICPDSQAILVRTSESGLDRAAGGRSE